MDIIKMEVGDYGGCFVVKAMERKDAILLLLIKYDIANWFYIKKTLRLEQLLM